MEPSCGRQGLFTYEHRRGHVQAARPEGCAERGQVCRSRLADASLPVADGDAGDPDGGAELGLIEARPATADRQALTQRNARTLLVGLFRQPARCTRDNARCHVSSNLIFFINIR